MWDAVPSIFWESICRGGLPFHAALLKHQGQGVILAAPGETGKSTCSRRVVFPWQSSCDDEVLVVSAPAGGYLAHPFPTWTDYLWERADNTWNVEDAVPLAGIFFFEQSPKDKYKPLTGAQAAIAATYSAEQIMNRFLRWFAAKEARELRRTMFANACAIVKQVPVFHLQVSLTGNFWEKIEAALGWR
jgi:SynChlorMet cassette protein ScmC